MYIQLNEITLTLAAEESYSKSCKCEWCLKGMFSRLLRLGKEMGADNTQGAIG